jgi:acetylornithine deacetylase/succinyl-diaminopimelate desuccinylase-like protein
MDDDTLHSEVIQLTRDLVRVDTTNGNETEAAEVLRARLDEAGVDCALVARDDKRANLLARIRGSGDGPSLAFVGHLDVVPADARDWTHPPFAAEIDDDGYLFGRGAVDMKSEVASRTVAMTALARDGFRPRGDLLLVMVADEEDGSAEVGMEWLVGAHPEIRADFALNEGGGAHYRLADGRVVAELSVGEKGTCPVLVEALGEAGHASMPSVGRNAVPLLGELLRRIGSGMPTPARHEVVDQMLATLLGPGQEGDLLTAIDAARRLSPMLEHTVPAVCGTTMAPTMLTGSPARNVMPARAGMELDCRVLPGTTASQVEAEVRTRLGDGIPYELSFPEPMVEGSSSPPAGPLWDACSRWARNMDQQAQLLATMCTGFTDSVYLREAFGTVAYGFSPTRTTPAEVLEEGIHNRDERIHVDDLLLGVQFHLDIARQLLGPTLPRSGP